ncbi:Protein SCO1 [Fusarium oxysporum f. sp. albedinis]|nr:Protein SCO1 [Fusarium oxysporum f. sp. albedinis]
MMSKESSFNRVWTVELDKVLTQEQSQSSRLCRGMDATSMSNTNTNSLPRHCQTQHQTPNSRKHSQS